MYLFQKPSVSGSGAVLVPPPQKPSEVVFWICEFILSFCMWACHTSRLSGTRAYSEDWANSMNRSKWEFRQCGPSSWKVPTILHHHTCFLMPFHHMLPLPYFKKPGNCQRSSREKGALATEGQTWIRLKSRSSALFRCIFKAKARKNHNKRKKWERNENKQSKEQNCRLTVWISRTAKYFANLE